MWKRVDTPYKKDHLLKTMNIEKNYDNYKAQKMKYPPCNSKVFRNKVKYTIKYKTITNKTSSSHSQPLPGLILSLKKTA